MADSNIRITSDSDILLAKDTAGNEFYVGMYQDDNATWEQDECPVGHLMTWARRYRIGDKHDYDDPRTYWIDTITNYYEEDYRLSKEENDKRFIDFYKHLTDWGNVDVWSKKDVESSNWYKENEIPLNSDFYLCHSDEEGFLTSDGWQYKMSTDKPEDFTDDDKECVWHILQYLTLTELEAVADQMEDFYYYRVYLMDHGGISLSLHDFYDHWDSGCIGYWTCTKEEADKEGWNTKDDSWKDTFHDVIKGMIDEFNEIAMGNVWGFAIARKEELDSYKDSVDKYVRGLWVSKLHDAILRNSTDSCWGFVGDYDDRVVEYCNEMGLEIVEVL